MILGGLFLSLFLPLLVSNSIFFPFISGKNFAFRIIVEIIFAAWIILALRAPEYRPKFSLLLKSLLVFLGVIAVADIFGVYPYKSFWSNFERMEGLLGFIHLIAYFVVAGSVIKKEKLWSAVFHTSIGISLFVCLFAVMQIGGELAINQGGLRVDATFGNAIYLAVYLLFHLFIVKKRLYGPKELFKSTVLGSAMFLLYYLVRISSDKIEPHSTGLILSVVSLALLVYSGYMLVSRKDLLIKISRSVFEWLFVAFYIMIILYTATRGVIIGLAASLFTLGVVLVLTRGEGVSTNLRKIGAGILIFFVLAGGGFFILRDVPAIKNHKIFGRLVSISINNDDAKARFMVWNMALEGVKENPILGWGQENFNYVFNKYYDPKMYAREQWFDRTHNVFFDWLIAGGILGLLSYLAIFYAALRLVWKAPAGKPDDITPHTLSYQEKAVLIALLVGYFFQNFFVFDNLTSYLIFFLILSYIHSVSVSGIKHNEPQRRKADVRPIMNIALPAVLVGLVASLYFFNARPISAGKTLIKALQPYPPSEGGLNKNLDYFKKALAYNTFTSTEIREQLAQVSAVVFNNKDTDESIKKNYFEFGFDELKKQLEMTPLDARYHLFMGVFLNAAGQYTESINYLDKASELSPAKQSILFEYGTSYLNARQFDKALEIFKKAYELEPAFGDARVIYAVGAIYADKFELAEELLSDPEGFGDKFYYDERLLRAYYDKKQYIKAKDVVLRKIETDSEKANLHLILAGLYLEIGSKVEAIAEIKKAVEVDPSLKETADKYISDINSGVVN